MVLGNFPDYMGAVRCSKSASTVHCSTRLDMFNIIFYCRAKPAYDREHGRKTCLTIRSSRGDSKEDCSECSNLFNRFGSTMFRSTKSWQAPILARCVLHLFASKAICTPRCWDVSSPTQVGNSWRGACRSNSVRVGRQIVRAYLSRRIWKARAAHVRWWRAAT